MLQRAGVFTCATPVELTLIIRKVLLAILPFPQIRRIFHHLSPENMRELRVSEICKLIASTKSRCRPDGQPVHWQL